MNIKKWFMNDESDVFNDGLTEQYYNLKAEDALEDGTLRLASFGAKVGVGINLAKSFCALMTAKMASLS